MERRCWGTEQGAQRTKGGSRGGGSGPKGKGGRSVDQAQKGFVLGRDGMEWERERVSGAGQEDGINSTSNVS